LGELVKILDFGIAKLVQANATQTHSFMGTLAYCSPEQMGGKELDNRSDIYSLGVMMYEMLTLEMPILPETSSFGAWYKAHNDFQPRPFESHVQIPLELKNIILKCLAKSRDDRPQTVAEVLKIIEGLEKTYNRTNSDNKTNYSGQETIVANDVSNSVSHDDRTEISSDATPPPPTPKSQPKIAKETKLTWPQNKPLQKIVFPRIVKTETETYPSLWVMLDKQDILNRVVSIRYNQFLFLSSPHPMILWITVIYNPTHGARWLPCYLDLKTESARQVVSSLSQLGSYKILFFALEEPQNCQHSMSSTIAPNQCAVMQEWIKNSTSFTTNKGDAKVSRQRLRDEFERLKPRILEKLAQSYK
jgi:serine/threonine-protein kinase